MRWILFSKFFVSNNYLEGNKNTEKTIACNDDEFFCESNQRCIVSDRVCDGYPDCVDHEDEKNCTENGQQTFDWSTEMVTSTEKVSAN